MTNLIRLAYVSKRSPGVTDDTVVDDIVLPSIIYNRSVEITGRMCFSDYAFVEVLEGESHEVRALYERIAADPRHHDIHVLLDTPVSDRIFTRFQMRVFNERTMPAVAKIAANRALRANDPLLQQAILQLAAWPGSATEPLDPAI